MRYFLRLSYNGSAYHGWQVQPNASTVQGALDKALITVLRHPLETVGCGRTDTGVHAREFFVHFDSANPEKEILPLVHRLNSILPQDIAIRQIYPVSSDAHARYDAVSRKYEYHISREKDPFTGHLTAYMNKDFNLTAMNNAAAFLLKQSDFTCFEKTGSQPTSGQCIVTEARWVMQKNRIVFIISANRFLRNMVRAIVGTLLEVGTGSCSQEEFKKVLASGNRSEAGASVPAHGLHLVRIDYPYIPRMR